MGAFIAGELLVQFNRGNARSDSSLALDDTPKGKGGTSPPHIPKLSVAEARYAPCSPALLMAMVSPTSPTLKRAKRLTEMFSPSLPITVAMSCDTVMVWSLMKGCSYRQTSS